MRLLSPQSRIELGQLRLDDLSNRFNKLVEAVLTEKKYLSKELSHTVSKADPSQKITNYRIEVEGFKRRMEMVLESGMFRHQSRSKRAESVLKSLSPHAVLNRGFAIVKNDLGRPVVSRKAIQSGDRVWVQFKDGEIDLIKD
jgi:exodeoxyribonuclease VII large subunit